MARTPEIRVWDTSAAVRLTGTWLPHLALVTAAGSTYRLCDIDDASRGGRRRAARALANWVALPSATNLLQAQQIISPQVRGLVNPRA